jgi:hypothetical protein
MTELAPKDHVVLFEQRFHDYGKYPKKIPAGTTLRMTKSMYNLLKGSDPDNVQLQEVSPPPGVLERIFAAAKEEKEAEFVEFEPTPEYQEALDSEGDILVDPPLPIEDWKPIGWYAAQLAKNGGMDD